MAQQHKISVQTYEVPIYPPIANVAHISGDVRLALNVAADGTITNVKVVSGPLMLVQSAKDAIIKWRFHCDDCNYGASFTHEFVLGYRLNHEKREQVLQFPNKMMLYAPELLIMSTSS